ncbi:MAG: Uncharacterized protein G01um101466_600 [Parcubacteria group bacterium Gr01-1014_66]|nr:MAG: Uncharacterized protein G01um101466_600 [Parcubacteria group bacterium Gr01-1014_66]
MDARMTDLGIPEKKERSVSEEVTQQIRGYIAASFGLVAGLAWNDAVKTLIEYLVPVAQNTVFAKFLYAVVITLFVVLITGYLMRPLRNNHK